MMSLYPYQEVGRDFLIAHPGAYLAHEAGLGKTVQALRAAARFPNDRLTVVCPASVVPHWMASAKEWAPGLDVHVLSYDTLRLHGVEVPPGTLVLDEAHYCKSPNAQRTQAALAVARLSRRVWALSGTPMPNDPRELWPQINIVRPEALGGLNYHQWTRRFCKIVPLPHVRRGAFKVVGVKRVEELRARLRGVPMQRRTVADVGLDLPPLRVDIQWLDYNEDLVRALKELGQEDPAELMESREAPFVRRILGVHKAVPVARTLAEELDGGLRKLIVFAHHHDTMDVLWHHLQRFGAVRLDGRTPPDQRQAAVSLFVNGDARVFIGQQQAAGTGLNLQVASEVVLVEPSWVPAENVQAIKRAHRIGTEHPVRARVFAVRGTLDEGLMRTLATKVRMHRELGLAEEEE